MRRRIVSCRASVLEAKSTAEQLVAISREYPRFCPDLCGALQRSRFITPCAAFGRFVRPKDIGHGQGVVGVPNRTGRHSAVSLPLFKSMIRSMLTRDGLPGTVRDGTACGNIG